MFYKYILSEMTTFTAFSSYFCRDLRSIQRLCTYFLSVQPDKLHFLFRNLSRLEHEEYQCKMLISHEINDKMFFLYS